MCRGPARLWPRPCSSPEPEAPQNGEIEPRDHSSHEPAKPLVHGPISIPLWSCHGPEINQVLLNIVVNAAQAIASQQREQLGKIIIKTFHDNEFIYCEINDDGPGIEKKHINMEEIHMRIFENPSFKLVPFFDPKDVIVSGSITEKRYIRDFKSLSEFLKMV